MKTIRSLIVHPLDNVIVLLEDGRSGDRIDCKTKILSLTEAVPAKHKVAIDAIEKGQKIFMYGVEVGTAIFDLKQGEAITTKNVTHTAMKPVIRPTRYKWVEPNVEDLPKTFEGIIRSDGQVGTANFWLVFPLVFCENRNIKAIKSSLEAKLGYEKPDSFNFSIDDLIHKYKNGATEIELQDTSILTSASRAREQRVFQNVDGIRFLTHNGGCGGTRQDSEMLCKLLAGYVNNPNVAGATVLSLGCQNAQISLFNEALYGINPSFNKPIYIINQQDSSSEREFIADAVKKTFIGLVTANKVTRKQAPISKLKVGLECGGSDGFSGISANPSVGYFSDLLVAQGGTSVLAEFPELHGVEQNIIDRCLDVKLANKFMLLMEAYQQRAISVGSSFDMNPSPGNIKDGLITDAMKSAGAAKKGGTSPIVDILDYTEQLKHVGLNLLCTPGNDVESTTALAASGCNLILFTTGLGTPTGNPIVPVVKISSNNKLFQKMPDIIDFNAGSVIEAQDTIETCGLSLYKYVIDVASGTQTTHATRLQQNDFIPWKRGFSL